ncbi:MULTISPECIES: glutathione S-transferase [unclassified Massilia]|uniref:glutathione S-transferase n=1 Tax=unclassified Massilia TaxID=2609279 RepID=UPI0017808C6B|nr:MULTISPECIES: glutathione S-transferase [unclassified Massilia]MBD8530398.1 glutathione S-transferase [Massilia sp. CFBP 13647]MBD8674304.1 glutathione S-transferase [Massilia sp. CFBP 13721]
MAYELFYWPSIQGRGEFVRLALEEAGEDYEDVARGPGGVDALMAALKEGPTPSFAPPFLRSEGMTIGQTAAILIYLGERHGLAPQDMAGRLWTHQLQLTIADLVGEAHDTHHPVGNSLYYEDQQEEARRRAGDFTAARIPKFFSYFGHVLGDKDYLLGAEITYADLSLFQTIEGLAYAFPQATGRALAQHPNLAALRQRVAERPRIAAYLSSTRRIPFNEEGIFRRYPELDS